ncbi:MAG: DHH family phosphoesterase, partial [bacterium]|nr:DHH family phosphoesterase [bacterium]
MECKLDDIIKNSKKILLLSHVNPDGDTLGSMCAMYSMIYNRFKIKADMNVVSNIPFNYKFLPNINLAQRVFDQSLVYDLVITLDVAAIDRVRDSKIFFDKAKCTVNIDHHKTNPGFGDYQII